MCAGGRDRGHQPVDLDEAAERTMADETRTSMRGRFAYSLLCPTACPSPQKGRGAPPP